MLLNGGWRRILRSARRSFGGAWQPDGRVASFCFAAGREKVLEKPLYKSARKCYDSFTLEVDWL
jgi:hypothetical protein